MSTTSSSIRRRQIIAWTFVSVFVLGFVTPVGAWTGPVLSVWLAGTQRVWRGFVLMLGFALLFGLPHLLYGLLHGGSGSLPAFLVWTLAAMVLGTLPFTFHRMVSPRLPGYFSTLPLPMFGVVFATIANAWLPASIVLDQNEKLSLPLQHLGQIFGSNAPVFATYWLAATLMWVWNQKSRTARIQQGLSFLGSVCVVAAGLRGASIPVASDVEQCRASCDLAGNKFRLVLPCRCVGPKRQSVLGCAERSRLGMPA